VSLSLISVQCVLPVVYTPDIRDEQCVVLCCVWTEVCFPPCED